MLHRLSPSALLCPHDVGFVVGRSFDHFHVWYLTGLAVRVHYDDAQWGFYYLGMLASSSEFSVGSVHRIEAEAIEVDVG